MIYINEKSPDITYLKKVYAEDVAPLILVKQKSAVDVTGKICDLKEKNCRSNSNLGI